MILNMNVHLVNKTALAPGDLREDFKVAAISPLGVVAVVESAHPGRSPTQTYHSLSHSDIPFSGVTQQVVLVASLCAAHQLHMGQG